ncbi:MAG: hypothetical protein NXI31_23290 [bacterium]|nr:hypothetical protein [bacterium]
MILNRPTLLTALAVSTFLAPATAQSNRFIPQDAQVVLRLAAPARWKTEFAGTKIAEVFGGQAFAPMLAGIKQGFMGGRNPDEGVDPELMESMWDNYEGEITVALHVDAEDIGDSIMEDRAPAMAIAFALSPHDSFDLNELAVQLRQMIENKEGDTLNEIEVGEQSLLCKQEDGIHLTVPTMIDDHLVMLFSTDMETFGERMITSENRHPGAGAGKAMFCHIDAKQGIDALMDFVAWQMENDLNAPPIDVVQLLTDLGLGCVRSIELSVAADGEQLVVESNLATTAEERGLLGALLVDKPTLDTLRYVPPAATAFSVQAFDVSAIYKTISNIWNGAAEVLPIGFEDVEIMFEEATKVRLHDDLIAHFGKEMLSLTDYEAQADADPEDMTAMFAGSCFGIALTDGVAFGESLEKALRSRGLHAARKTEEYESIKVYRLRLAGAFEIEYAITDDLLLLALGGDESSRAQLRSVLDTRANPSAGLPKAVAQFADSAPTGWNGVAVTPMATVMSQMGNIMDQLPPGGAPPEVAQMLSMISMLGKEMKAVGLDDAVGFSYVSPTGFRSIMRL